MKRFLSLSFVLLAVLAILAGPAQAEIRPINLCLWENISVFPASDEIQGLRLSIYGVSSKVSGVDIGVVSRVTGDFLGAQWSFVNWVGGNATGYQEGIVNYVEGDFLGWQTSAVNVTNGSFKGLQSALVNKAGDVRGVQIAIINLAESLYGLQIGLVNINNTPNPFPIFPIVNWSF